LFGVTVFEALSRHKHREFFGVEIFWAAVKAAVAFCHVLLLRHVVY
jgi:hypothetical protein